MQTDRTPLRWNDRSWCVPVTNGFSSIQHVDLQWTFSVRVVDDIKRAVTTWIYLSRSTVTYHITTTNTFDNRTDANNLLKFFPTSEYFTKKHAGKISAHITNRDNLTRVTTLQLLSYACSNSIKSRIVTVKDVFMKKLFTESINMELKKRLIKNHALQGPFSSVQLEWCEYGLTPYTARSLTAEAAESSVQAFISCRLDYCNLLRYVVSGSLSYCWTSHCWSSEVCTHYVRPTSVARASWSNCALYPPGEDNNSY